MKEKRRIYMDNQETNKYLGEEKISKILFKFAIPCILSLLISSLYNIVDQIFIGHSELGYLGNAATSVVFPITIISVAFAWCFGDGSAAFLSLAQGRKDTKDVHISIGNSILINFVISIIFVVLGFIFMEPLLRMFGASDVTLNIAKDYFRIILVFIPVYMMANVMNPIIRADGSPLGAMVATLIGAITNIILDPVFIFGLNMGIKGAAWATIIGQVLSLIVSIVYFIKHTKTFKLSKNSFKMNMGIFSNVIKLGVSTFITQMSIVIISLVCNIMLAKYGAQSKYGADIPIATIGICMKVFTIVINIVVGIILGAQPILGYNFGAKKIDRVKQTYKTVLISTVIVGIIATLIFELCPEVVIKMFGTESDLYMEFAVITFKTFLMFIIFTCTIKMTSIFFQAVGDPIKAAITSLLRDIVCFVPMVIILPKLYGVKGALYAAPVSDVIGIIVSTILVIIFFNKVSKTTETKQVKATIKESKEGIIIAISRKHGSQGKYIGKLISDELNIPYYYKEMTALAAQEAGLDREFIDKLNSSSNILRDLYLTSEPVKYAIEAQERAINMIADKGACVIVGRAADYILRDRKNVVRVFITANDEVRVKNIMDMYKDNKTEAAKNMKKSDKNRSSYYKTISGKEWGNAGNYDLCIDSSIGTKETANIIINYIKSLKK